VSFDLELLSPAGNMECLKTAFYFGADAVYLSGKAYGLRAFADNFSMEDLHEATVYAKQMDKKVYLTCNSFFHNDDFVAFDDYLKNVGQTGVDAIIASDPGVVMRIKEVLPDMAIHLSTQANATNYHAVKFWEKIGVARVILAREVSLDEIHMIHDQVPNMALEAFVHGAMCISYSGRCLFSNFTTGRGGNQGACAQPCRWEYHISEKDGDDYYPIYADERGTYLFNSKDLMMIEHIDKLIKAGITSFKIEGRMKTAYYVASVIKPYRGELDKCIADLDGYKFDPSLLHEVEKTGTRAFTTGFFLGNPKEDGQDTVRDQELKSSVFVGKVLEDAVDGVVKIEQRNKFLVGEMLEVLSPNHESIKFEVTKIVNTKGEDQESAPHPQQVLYLDCPIKLSENDMLRRDR
jgi:U32 family peptidase